MAAPSRLSIGSCIMVDGRDGVLQMEVSLKSNVLEQPLHHGHREESCVMNHVGVPQTATQLLIRLDGKEQWIPRNSPRLSNVPLFTAAAPTRSAEAASQHSIDEYEDDECFVCGNGGKLTCCDVCPRVYHLRCLPADDCARLRRPDAADEDWWCPRCRRLAQLAFCMTRELSHPAIGAPEASVAEVAERLHAFMSSPQHEQQWESLREAGQALMSSMPYTLPWMLGDDATVAASVDAPREEAIAAQEGALPVPERVAPEWYTGHCSESSGVPWDEREAPQPHEDYVAGAEAAFTACDEGDFPDVLGGVAEIGGSAVTTAYLAAGAAVGAATGLPPSASPAAPVLPSGFAFRPSSAQPYGAGGGGMAQTDGAKVAATPAVGGEEAGGPMRTSRYRGVSRRYGKWKARIKQNGSDLVIGDFDDELEAAHAYDAKARQLHGDRAMLNFPVPR